MNSILGLILALLERVVESSSGESLRTKVKEDGEGHTVLSAVLVEMV